MDPVFHHPLAYTLVWPVGSWCGLYLHVCRSHCSAAGASSFRYPMMVQAFAAAIFWRVPSWLSGGTASRRSSTVSVWSSGYVLLILCGHHFWKVGQASIGVGPRSVVKLPACLTFSNVSHAHILKPLCSASSAHWLRMWVCCASMSQVSLCLVCHCLVFAVSADHPMAVSFLPVVVPFHSRTACVCGVVVGCAVGSVSGGIVWHVTIMGCAYLLTTRLSHDSDLRDGCWTCRTLCFRLEQGHV